jgi:hypothetical protein
MRARFAELNLGIESLSLEKDFFRLKPKKSKV